MWPPVPGLGVSAAADPPLPGELRASWIATFVRSKFSRAKRPFSGAIAVGMARLGGFDPEFPVENGTRQWGWSHPSDRQHLQINNVL